MRGAVADVGQIVKAAVWQTSPTGTFSDVVYAVVGADDKMVLQKAVLPKIV